MHEGQELDFAKLRKLGVAWVQAMRYTREHPLGFSYDAEIVKWIEQNAPDTTFAMEDLGDGRSVSRGFGGCATCDGAGCGDCRER